MRVIKFLLIVLAICITQTQAQSIFVEKGLTATLHKVVSPTEVLVKLNREDKELILSVQLVAVRVPEPNPTVCKDVDKNYHCLMLKNALEDKTFGVTVDRSSERGVWGDLIVNKASLVEKLIRNGAYYVDGLQTRNVLYLNAELWARCHQKGVWEFEKGNNRIARQCQSI